MNVSEEDLTELFLSLGSKQSASYDGNLQKLGYADFSEPSGINIYPKDFQSKEQVVKILDDYNSRMEADGKEEQVITYTDVVGTLMSSVTDIVDIISLRSDCVCGNLTGRFFDHDRCHHVYQCTGAKKRNRYPPCHRCVQRKCIASL